MNRQQRANENWREKFEALGLSNGFVFVGRDWSSEHGHKATVKCEKCGTVFSTWAIHEIVKGRQSRLLCPECGASSDGADVWARSPRCDEAMAYYVQGHSVRETAEQFCISEIQINNAVKIRGLTNGKDWNKAGVEAAKRRGEQIRKLHEAEKLKAQAERKKQAEERRQRREAEKERIRREREAKREAEKLAKNPLGLSYYQLEQIAKLDNVSVCRVCGKEYTLREYMKSTGSRYYRDSGYCSAECRDANLKEHAKMSHKGRQDSHRHRAVKFGCVYDSSVTLAKLIKRDGLRCALCGKMCDPNDHSWSEYSGPMYPSIDHIVPMSKGGGHVWDNVQVAHIICNSEKGAT